MNKIQSFLSRRFKKCSGKPKTRTHSPTELSQSLRKNLETGNGKINMLARFKVSPGTQRNEKLCMAP